MSQQAYRAMFEKKGNPYLTFTRYTVLSSTVPRPCKNFLMYKSWVENKCLLKIQTLNKICLDELTCISMDCSNQVNFFGKVVYLHYLQSLKDDPSP